MIRTLKIAVFGLALGTIALFVALALGWSSYGSSTAAHILSIVFGWPFYVTRGIPDETGSDTAFILAIVINYSFYILLAWLLSRFRIHPPRMSRFKEPWIISLVVILTGVLAWILLW